MMASSGSILPSPTDSIRYGLARRMRAGPRYGRPSRRSGPRTWIRRSWTRSCSLPAR